MSYTLIDLQQQDGIATLTLNRPASLNAISRQMADELTDILTRFAADENLRVLVLRGAGELYVVRNQDNEVAQLQLTEDWSQARVVQRIVDPVLSRMSTISERALMGYPPLS